MFAMVLNRFGGPLLWEERPDPMPGPGEIRLKIEACGVCRTDLHVYDDELPDIRLPIIPGHEIVGRVDLLGPGVPDFRPANGSAFPGSAGPARRAGPAVRP